MKRYRLKKDLPFAKAGEVFQEWLGERNQKGERALFSKNHIDTNLWPNDIDNFDEWFEEIKEPKLPKEFFFIVGEKNGNVEYLTFSFDEETRREYKKIVEEYKSIGNCFETRKEAESYLDFLKAKEVIKQDTKGFKPGFGGNRDCYYFGVWDYEEDEPYSDSYRNMVVSSIKFRTATDIEASFKKHRREWKIYLTYHQ